MTNKTGASLYERLGGYDPRGCGRRAAPRLQGDPQLGVYWRGQNDHTKKRGRQMLLDFLVSALGGPAIYHGLDMRTAHQGLRINNSDWAVMERHVLAVLDKFGIQGREREEFLEAAAYGEP